MAELLVQGAEREVVRTSEMDKESREFLSGARARELLYGPRSKNRTRPLERFRNPRRRRTEERTRRELISFFSSSFFLSRKLYFARYSSRKNLLFHGSRVRFYYFKKSSILHLNHEHFEKNPISSS